MRLVGQVMGAVAGLIGVILLWSGVGWLIESGGWIGKLVAWALGWFPWEL